MSVHLEEWRVAEADELDAQTRAAGVPFNRAVICIEGAEPICLRREPVRGEEDPGVVEVFVSDGQRRVIGWTDHSMDDVDAEGRPVEIVAAASGTGTFVSVLLAPGDPIRLLTWRDSVDVPLLFPVVRRRQKSSKRFADGAEADSAVDFAPTNDGAMGPITRAPVSGPAIGGTAARVIRARNSDTRGGAGSVILR